MAEIPGILAMAVIDRSTRATVWSMTVGPAADARRAADEVLHTVDACERILAAHDASETWHEVVLLSPDSYDIVRPFGPTEPDGLLAEMLLDRRQANLAGARQQLSRILDSHRYIPDSHRYEHTAERGGQTSPSAALQWRVPPHRAAADDQPDWTVADTDLLHRVLAVLRQLT